MQTINIVIIATIELITSIDIIVYNKSLIIQQQLIVVIEIYFKL